MASVLAHFIYLMYTKLRKYNEHRIHESKKIHSENTTIYFILTVNILNETRLKETSIREN
jgi:hypothetical protein